MTPAWEGLPYVHVDGPIARIVRVDFDREQDPLYLHLLVSDDVAARVAELVEIEQHDIVGRNDLRGMVIRMDVVADICRAIGRRYVNDEPLSALRDCVVYILANRWWENGISEAPSAGLKPDVTPR